MTSVADITLEALLPSSIASDAAVAASAAAVDPHLKAAASAVDTPAILWRFGTLSSGQLDHLAAMFDVRPWSEAWSLDLKRSMLTTIVQTKRKVGTVGAVKAALSAFGGAAILQEWWQTDPQGDPHTFSVTVAMDGVSDMTEEELLETQATVQALIEAAKPARSHFTFSITSSISGGAATHAWARGLAVTRLTNF